MDLSIAYGLLTALGYGTSDFVAKLAIEKIGYLRSTLYMQIVGSVFILLVLKDRLVLHQGIEILAILAGVAVLGYFS